MEVDRVQKTPPIKVRRLHTDIRQTNRDKERERDGETERQKQRRDTFSEEEDILFPLPTSFLIHCITLLNLETRYSSSEYLLQPSV